MLIQEGQLYAVLQCSIRVGSEEVSDHQTIRASSAQLMSRIPFLVPRQSITFATSGSIRRKLVDLKCTDGKNSAII
jgi:hypothetical protein